MASGPQHDRIAKLTSSLGPFDLGVANRSGLDMNQVLANSGIANLESNAQVASYMNEINRLKEENDHIKKYTQRLESELSRYQIKFPGAHIDAPSADDDALVNADMPPWLSNSKYMSPLLNAYDNRIKELESLNNEMTLNFDKLRQEFNNITEDNKQLHAELQNEYNSKIKSMESNPIDSNSKSIGIVASDAINELNEQLDVLMRENMLITEQITLYESDVDRLSKEGRERDEQLVTISRNFQLAVSALHKSQEMTQKLQEERDICQRQIFEISAQMADVSTIRDNLQGEVEHYKNECSTLTNQVNEQKKLINEIAERTSNESDMIEQQSLIISERSRDLKTELSNKERELDQAKDKLRQLNMEHDSVRQDCEGMLKVISNLENKVSEFEAKEKNLSILQKQCKESVEQAHLERDQANAREVQSRREIARLLDKRRVLTKEALLKEQESVNEMKTKMQSQLQRKEDEINELTRQAAELTHAADRAKRNQRSIENEYSAFKVTTAASMKRLDDELKALVERTEQAEQKAMEREQIAHEAVKRANANETELASQRAGLQVSIRGLEQRLTESTMELEAVQSECKRLRGDLDENSIENSRLRQELSNMQTSADSKLASQAEHYNSDIKRLQSKINEFDSNNTSLSQEVALLKQKLSKLQGQAQEELQANTSHFERLIHEQRDECNRLRNRNEEISGRLEVLQHDRGDLDATLLSSQSTIHKLEASVRSLEVKCNDYKNKLSEFFGNEEIHIKEMQELKTKLDKLELSKQRVERERDSALRAVDMARSTVFQPAGGYTRQSGYGYSSPTKFSSEVVDTARTPLSVTSFNTRQQREEDPASTRHLMEQSRLDREIQRLQRRVEGRRHKYNTENQ